MLAPDIKFSSRVNLHHQDSFLAFAEVGVALHDIICEDAYWFICLRLFTGFHLLTPHAMIERRMPTSNVFKFLCFWCTAESTQGSFRYLSRGMAFIVEQQITTEHGPFEGLLVRA
jgi:hypothetical protein